MLQQLNRLQYPALPRIRKQFWDTLVSILVVGTLTICITTGTTTILQVISGQRPQ
jgi:hypothetical protein